MGELGNASVLGRLLEEISWEGRRVRAYRHGGRGLENVPTAEVLLPLSYLPRSMFLGAVIRAATGADVTRAPLVTEITQAEIVLLSETSLLGPQGVVVQPDATIATPTCHVLAEAKRNVARPSSPSNSLGSTSPCFRTQGNDAPCCCC